MLASWLDKDLFQRCQGEISIIRVGRCQCDASLTVEVVEGETCEALRKEVYTILYGVKMEYTYIYLA